MGKNPDYRNGICTNDKSLLEVYATPILVMGSVMELSKSLLQSKYPRPMGKNPDYRNGICTYLLLAGMCTRSLITLYFSPLADRVYFVVIV